MHLSDFDYELPEELIAHEPARPRDSSRMLVVNRRSGTFEDSAFRRIPDFLRPGDLLVINDTRVIKARMYGVLERKTGMKREVEVLFANPLEPHVWEVLCKPGRRIREGDRVIFGSGEATAIFGGSRAGNLRILRVDSGETVMHLLDRFGHIPLPPYIPRPDGPADAIEYQTVFATTPGAVAAPTAGLHFTAEVFKELERRGVDVASITLHVGIGTFVPVRTDNPQEHRLKPEWFNISDEAARQLNAAKSERRRIIAVGTTCTRTLEHVVSEAGRFKACQGYADTYILPGYSFRAIDGLLTNFHLPRSTLLMLVYAYSSSDLIRRAYRHAIAEGYRFYSFGDCMLVT